MLLASGLPLLTCLGEGFASRLGASLCAAVGMEDLIFPSAGALIERPIALGREPGQLQQRRQRLLDPSAKLPLFNTAAWVKELETLLQHLPTVKN